LSGSVSLWIPGKRKTSVAKENSKNKLSAFNVVPSNESVNGRETIFRQHICALTRVEGMYYKNVFIGQTI
jgi:hypothetical protein